MKKLEEPGVGSIIGIVGIGSTAVVGFVVYFMQKRADRRINLIIESEDVRTRNQKIRFCNKILDNLYQIKMILESINKIAQDFPNRGSDQAALRDATGFIMLNNMAMQNRLIPGIEECNRILLDHYNDRSIYDDLISVERFGGPSAVLVQQEKKQKLFSKMS
jgi:hypothetical protein